MRRLIAILLLIWAASAHAQSDITPDARFLIADLGIELPVPSTWMYREADGVYFGANERDLNAAADNDAATVPSAPVMQLVAVPLQDPQAVNERPLADTFTTVAQQLGFQITGEALGASVIGRLSLTGFGTVGSAGMILTVWIQEDRLVVFSLLTPDAASATAQARAWGTILSSIAAVDALPLERRAVSTYGFEMAYPADWTPLNAEASGLFGVFETAEDAQLVVRGGGSSTTGIADASVVVSLNRFEDLRLTDDSTTLDLQQILTGNLGLSELQTRGEFYVNGRVGTGLYGRMPNGRWLHVVGTLDAENDLVFFYMLAAPTEARLLELQPTYLAMLHSTNLDLSELSQ